MFKNSIKINSSPVENPLITLKKVSKSFGSQEVLSDVDFIVNKKDRLAIVGSNGAGKSTLLK